MQYPYKCSKCEHEYICSIPMDDYKIPQPCPECGVKNEKLFRPTRNFILKGDGWAGKNSRINQQMREKNKKLDARTAEMKRDAPNVTLAPNVDGERVDSWSDAQKLAKSKGKSTESYEPMIAKEKESKK
jgi:putative FmdB family regulatory protein